MDRRGSGCDGDGHKEKSRSWLLQYGKALALWTISYSLVVRYYAISSNSRTGNKKENWKIVHNSGVLWRKLILLSTLSCENRGPTKLSQDIIFWLIVWDHGLPFIPFYRCSRCFEIARLSKVERELAAVIFTRPPKSTYEEALKYFLEAHKGNTCSKPSPRSLANPTFLFTICRMAQCYYKLKNKEAARRYAERALSEAAGDYETLEVSFFPLTLSLRRKMNAENCLNEAPQQSTMLSF